MNSKLILCKINVHLFSEMLGVLLLVSLQIALYVDLVSAPKKTHFDYYSFLNRRSHIQAEVNVMQSICNVDYIRKA